MGAIESCYALRCYFTGAEVAESKSSKQAVKSNILPRVDPATGLPVLVFRCMQHIVKHHDAEEGLFRTSGNKVEADELTRILLDTAQREQGATDSAASAQDRPHPTFQSQSNAQADGEGAPTSDDEGDASAPADRSATVDLSRFDYRSVAQFIKHYFRILLGDRPVMTEAAYPDFVEAYGHKDWKAIDALVTGLPASNQAALGSVLDMLAALSDDEHKRSRMTTHNLALVFAPCLLRANPDDETMQEMLMHAPSVTGVVEYLVKQRLRATQGADADTGAVPASSAPSDAAEAPCEPA